MRALLQLWLGALVVVHAVMPGLAVAAAPSGPVVPAVLCAEHGPVEVLIDLGTGEPVDNAHHAGCDLCTFCKTAGLLPPDAAAAPLPTALTLAETAPTLSSPAPALRAAPASARGPPSL
jgi:hypothetical protein